MISVTCAALAAALLNSGSAGKHFVLKEDCGPANGSWALTVKPYFNPPVTIDAGNHIVHGINVATGGGLRWRGGTIVAPEGPYPQARPHGYGVRIWAGTRDISFDRTTFTNARKAIVTHQTRNISVTNSRFHGRLEDGLIASETNGIVFSHNKAGPFDIIYPKCALPNGSVLERLPRRDCEPRGGVWTDGWHADVLQIRNATTDVVAEYNEIDTPGQGLANMDAKTDLPVARVRFSHNRIKAVTHWLTLGPCEDCQIDHNVIEKNGRWRAVIHPGTARACGNKSADGGPGLDPC